MLEAIGVGFEEERVYRLLVSTLDGDPRSMADRLGRDPGDVVRALEALAAKGLVRRSAPGTSRFTPTPPDVAFGPLLIEGQEALEGARGTIAQLAHDYHNSLRRRDPVKLVEVITGAAEIRQQLRDLQLGARREMVWFCKAGYVAMTSDDNSEEFAALAKGVVYRVIYEQALLEEPGMLDSLAAGIRAGEVARSAPALPVRLAIADGELGLCPLVPAAQRYGEPTAALIRDSNLLTALIALFEAYWERAAPLRDGAGSGGGPLDRAERVLLSLLVAGVTDKAIATRLGVSERTVQRRVADLLRLAGARTRTQLAWQAAHLGWLDGLCQPVRAHHGLVHRVPFPIGGPHPQGDVPVGRGPGGVVDLHLVPPVAG